MRLLICDDSKTIRILLRTALVTLGHSDITEVGDGRAALDAIAAGPAFDAVLLDLHMPQMDGLAVLKELKSKPETAKIPVVIVSSDADMRNVEQARQLGALGYIRKPFRPDGIAKALEAATSNARISQRIVAPPPK